MITEIDANHIEVTAKKPQDAINEGLEFWKVTLDKVNVDILESGGLFKKAKVRLTLEAEEEEPKKHKPAPKSEQKREPAPAKQEPAKKQAEHKKTEQPVNNDRNKAKQSRSDAGGSKNVKPQKAQDDKEKSANPPAPQAVQEPVAQSAEEQPKERTQEELLAAEHAFEFVKTVVEKMGFTEFTARKDEEAVVIDAPEGDDSLIIGRHGETLSALSYLAEMTARAEKAHINVTVDCNGYRGRRAASLTAMARRRANECASKGRKIKLEPMERIDRRTIHNALNDDGRVTTASEGKEPYRYVVILPKRNGERKR